MDTGIPLCLFGRVQRAHTHAHTHSHTDTTVRSECATLRIVMQANHTLSRGLAGRQIGLPGSLSPCFQKCPSHINTQSHWGQGYFEKRSKVHKLPVMRPEQTQARRQHYARKNPETDEVHTESHCAHSRVFTLDKHLAPGIATLTAPPFFFLNSLVLRGP